MKQIFLVLLILSTILTLYLAYRMYKSGTCSAEGFEDGTEKAEGGEEGEEDGEDGEDGDEGNGKGKNAQSETNNALLSLMGNIKRINGYLMDPNMWAHRIGLIGMTPVEMARQELNRQKQEQT